MVAEIRRGSGTDSRLKANLVRSRQIEMVAQERMAAPVPQPARGQRSGPGIGRLKPVPLSLEWVSRQRDSVAKIRAIEAAPVDPHPLDIQKADRFEHLSPI